MAQATTEASTNGLLNEYAAYHAANDRHGQLTQALYARANPFIDQ